MNKVGQPKKNILNALQTIFWYRYVEMRVVANLHEEELEQFYKAKDCNIWLKKLDEQIRLREAFHSSKLSEEEINSYHTNPNKVGHHFNQAESRIWYKYAKGETKPNAVKLARIDKVINNASFYFKHPIWNFLKTRPNTKADLDIFLQKLEQSSIKAINNGKIIDPRRFYTDQCFDKDEFLKYGNILDFYSYILYSYYVARFALDSQEIDNCIVFFICNLEPIISIFCLESIFFLKICQIHMKPMKFSDLEEFEIFKHFEVIGLLPTIREQLKNENNNYDFLSNLTDQFILD